MTALDSSLGPLEHAGLPRVEVERWVAARPTLPTGDTHLGEPQSAWARLAEPFVRGGDALRRRLPPKPRRGAAEQAAAEALLRELRDVRARFARSYAEPIYRELTRGYAAFLRADELVYTAAERYPGLTPTRREVRSEQALLQKDKDGVEVDQGLLLAQVLAHPRAGAHLVHAMLRPKSESLEQLGELRRTGAVDLGTVRVERRGKAAWVTLHNPDFLNAEDDTTLGPLETAVDLVLLDEASEVGVIRGSAVDHPKYRGRRVFDAGLNLTHLYRGQISYLFFVTRDMGPLHKIYRGLTGPEFWPGEPETTLEKAWIAAVETFAIGGGCQLLLVADHVLAESGASFSLPARKEGIIPGVANLRLARFVGERLARQAILFDRRFAADSPEGRLICDRVVPQGEMDAAVEAAVGQLTGPGLVSVAANRKALRVGQETPATFRAYMALFAREQAFCHYSPRLIRNLEEHWNARRQRVE